MALHILEQKAGQADGKDVVFPKLGRSMPQEGSIHHTFSASLMPPLVMMYVASRSGQSTMYENTENQCFLSQDT